MKIHTLLLYIIPLLFACTESAEQTAAPKTIEQEQIITAAPAADQPALPATAFKLKFKEVELSIDSLMVWDEEGKLKLTQTDTAEVYLELGESVEGRLFNIKSIGTGNIKVFQRFENSVTIMNEGPHCDLTEWKHYNSDWQLLPVTNGRFTTSEYSEEDRERFVTVSMQELCEAVRQHCGDFWADHIKNSNSPTDYPAGVSTSRIFLKFEITDPETNSTHTRYVAFEVPMGC